MENMDLFVHKDKLIRDRILLALEINPNKKQQTINYTLFY